VFLKIDSMLLSEQGKKDLTRIAKTAQTGHTTDGSELSHQAGCTANVCLVTATHVYCANAGDARCVISENGVAIDMSVDHKPDLPSERSRVITAGHIVEDGRVDGIIAISRAIGDWEYKSKVLEPQKMAVSAYPDIKVHKITEKTKYFICACDGIWDCMTSQQACDFVVKAKDKQASYTKSPTKTSSK